MNRDGGSCSVPVGSCCVLVPMLLAGKVPVGKIPRATDGDPEPDLGQVQMGHPRRSTSRCRTTRGRIHHGSSGCGMHKMQGSGTETGVCWASHQARIPRPFSSAYRSNTRELRLRNDHLEGFSTDPLGLYRLTRIRRAGSLRLGSRRPPIGNDETRVTPTLFLHGVKDSEWS